MNSQRGHGIKCIYYKDSLSNMVECLYRKIWETLESDSNSNDLCGSETWWCNAWCNLLLSCIVCQKLFVKGFFTFVAFFI